MQQRRGITNKQHATTASSKKPELPTTEPPYEVIEFPGQQQYSNTLPLRNVQKTSADKKNEKKCDLCGCSNAQFFCDVCVQQTFCASCDQMYHRHPKRQKHIRRRIQQPAQKGMEPPLPPKNEFNSAPVPPPRRNKRATRTGTPNSQNQGTVKKNGSLMGSLKRFMGGMQNNTPQSTLNRMNAKSPNPMPHSSSTTDSDRQSGSRNFGYLDWKTDSRHRAGSFSAFNSPFPSLMQAQSMAQLNCPSCHHQGRSSWDWNRSRDWNRSQMNLNALPPWTGLAAGNPWHGSIIIPPPYPMIPNDEFVRRDSFHSQRSGRHRRPPKFRLEDDDSDISVSDDRQSMRKTKSPHLLRTASPALSRRSRRTVASESEDEEQSTTRRSDPRFKRRTVPTSRDCSPALSRRGFRKKYAEDDDAMSMKSVGSRRSAKSSRSYLRKTRHHTSSNSDDELTSDKDADVHMDIQTSPLPQCESPLKNVSKANSPTEKPSEKLEDWECEHCTYLNSKESKVCDVCCKSRTRQKSPSPAKNEDVQLESSMKNMRISLKNAGDAKKKGNENPEGKTIKSISTGTSPPPQTTSTQTYDIPQYSGKRNRSLSCEDYSDWNPAKKPNSILSSSSGKQSSFQADSSQSSEYIHSLLQNHVKHGAEIVKLLKEAELHHFELEDVTAALAQCGDENPIKWLTENWNKMIDTVVTLATNYGREQVENTVGTISSMEAQAALRLHNGDIWAAVTECIRQRQTKYAKLMSRGLYSREDVVTVLTANHGNLEAAYKELSKNQLKPFLMKIWGPPQGLDNDSGDISKLHYKDYEYDTDNKSVELPTDKQDFNRIQSWLDTASTSASEFDEYLRFEEALINLKNQSNSNNHNTFLPHLWEQRTPKVILQNELNRYNSCENLKTRFDNILSRKKFYASTDLLSTPKVDNNYRLHLNHSEIGKGRRNGMGMNFQQPHEVEQYLIMNKNAKRHAIIENDQRNETNVDCSLENYIIKNYLNNEFNRQEIQPDAHSISGQLNKVHSNLGQIPNDLTECLIADHKIDLNDGLLESKNLASEINSKVISDENGTNFEGTTPSEVQISENGKPKLQIIQNLPSLTLQNNSESYAAAFKSVEIEPSQTFDLENKSGATAKNVEDRVEAMKSSNYMIERTQPAANSEQHSKSEPGREQQKYEKTWENSTPETHTSTNNDIQENEVSKAEEFLPVNNEMKIEVDKIHEFNESKSIVADQVNEAAIQKDFSTSLQNPNHLTHVETEVHRQPEEFEKSNIPNMISEQPSNKSILKSESFPPTTQKSALSQEPDGETENAILLPELNALYWLAKRFLDFHIIEMKDAPLHTSSISKTYINDTLESEQSEHNSEQISKNETNSIENSNKIETFSMSQQVNEVTDKAEGNTTGKKTENLTHITENIATEIESNEYFLLVQEKLEKSINQDEVTKISTSEIPTEGVSTLAEKEQPQEFANKNRNPIDATNEITANLENDSVISDEKLANSKNKKKIASTIHIILVNEKDEHILSNNQNSDPSHVSLTENITSVTEQNETPLMVEAVTGTANQNEIIGNTTYLNRVYRQNIISTDMKPTDQQDTIPLSVEKEIETPSKQEEIADDSLAVTSNKENCQQSNEEKMENSQSHSTMSTTVETKKDENVIILEDETKESKNEIEVSNISSSVESDHESENSERSADDENEKSSIKEKILIENCKDVTSADCSLSENGIEADTLQISKHQLVFKAITIHREENKSEQKMALKVEDNNASKVHKKPKKNFKNKKGSEIAHLNKNETQPEATANISSERAAIEDLESKHSENDSNKTQEIQVSVENEELHQTSNSVSTNQLLENSATIVENGTTEPSDAFDEPPLQFEVNITENTREEVTEIINEEDSEDQDDDLQTEANQYLKEGLVSTIDQAELAAQLIQLKFDRSQSIDAANECSNINSAIVYLQQECHLCAEKFSMKQMISLLECEHKCCQECARQFFSLQINEKSIEHCVCPFCGEPKLSQLDSDSIFNYFSNLDILLKTILEPHAHELFQQKLRDRTLMQDPSFKWCAKCSFGFIADLDQKRLSCPSCKAVSCANCGQLWTREHHGKSCEEYNKWLATQNDSNNQLVNYLEENGVTCPKCDTKFILVKGGCMHLTCTHCKYEFCSDCFKPFSMGADCKQSDYCVKLGLHAHHPRNCLFYLRDKEPGELKQLLLENNIELHLQKSKEKRCSVQLQRETDDGLIDTKCNALVEEGGLCRTHYIEYLASLIRKNKIDPVSILDLTEILQELRRQGKSLPIRSANSFEHEYRRHCIEMVKEEIPLG